jgi:hypothetical protein
VRRLVGGWATAVALLTIVAPAGRVVAAPPNSDESALLAAYAPVVAIRHQAEPCGEGERYLPVSVDHVLGRDDVVLRAEDDTILQRAPTAESLPRDDPEVWMDLPGDALAPGCTYEQWFKAMHASPAVYGRVTYQDDDTIVQYWLYWVFNQWNDLHEGDWEMVQLIFETPTAAAAMQAGPTLYAYAQHEGSEVQVSGPDGGVRLVDGTHPVVHSAEGSHASYFAPARWFGKSGATGFGCDNTDTPNDELHPEVIPLPGDDVPTSGPLAWLGFTGHWGEQQAAFNNGPTGPVTKDQWSDPIGWVVDKGRDGAVQVPFADSKAVDTFCSLAEKGSALFNHLLDHPLLITAAIVAAIVAAIAVVRRSSRGLLGKAARMWRRSARRLAAVGFVLFVGAALAAVLQYLVREHTRVGTLMEAAGQSSPWVLPIVTVVGSLVAIPVVAWVTVASIAVDDGAPTAGAALAAPWRGLGTAVLAAIVLLYVVGLGVFAFILILLVASRWLVAPVVAVRDRVSLGTALGRSHRMIWGSSWRAIGLLVTLLGVAFLAGFAGALLLALTDVSFLAASIVTSLLGVVIVPYIAMVLVAYHDDLAVRPAG